MPSEENQEVSVPFYKKEIDIEIMYERRKFVRCVNEFL